MTEKRLIGYWGGNDKVYVKYVEGDKRCCEVIPFKPFLFIPSGKGDAEYRSMYGYPLYRKRYPNRFTMSKDFEANSDKFTYHGTLNTGLQYVAEAFPLESGRIEDFRILYFDMEIECPEGFPDPEKAEWPINAITAIAGGKRYVFRFYDREPKVSGDVRHVVAHDEESMLKKFLKFLDWFDPDIITGWYIKGFDIPYLYNRLVRVLGSAKALSPFGVVSKRGKDISIVGVNIVDLLDAYRKFERKERPAYTLEVISQIELGVGKHKIPDGIPGFLLWKYEQHYDDFFEYAMQDTDRVYEIDKKKGILDLMITIAIKTHSNVSDVLGTVRVWENYIYTYLYQNKRVPFLRKMGDEDRKRKLVGAYVLEPIVGRHRYVVSFDLTSLYPSIMMSLNMSPETYVAPDENVDVDCAKAPNGARFRKDFRGVVPELIELLFRQRKEYKRMMLEAGKRGDDEEKKYYKLRSDAIKVLMNGLYGAMSNAYFNFYMFEVAEAITTTGRVVGNYLRKSLNNYVKKITGEDGKYICASDTDSAYVIMDKVVEKLAGDEDPIEFLKRISDGEIQERLERTFEYMAKHEFNAFENRFHADREKIASAAIFTAKKKYCMLVMDSEGVPAKDPEGDLEVVGLQAVQAEYFGKKEKALKAFYRVCLLDDREGAEDLYHELMKDFMTWDVDDVAFNTTVRNLEKKQVGTPAHVKAALAYNYAIEKGMFEGFYRKIAPGDKIKWAYLVRNNPFREEGMAWFHGECPKELERFVDRRMQFEKLMASAMFTITEALGWENFGEVKTVSLNEI